MQPRTTRGTKDREFRSLTHQATKEAEKERVKNTSAVTGKPAGRVHLGQFHQFLAVPYPQ